MFRDWRRSDPGIPLVRAIVPKPALAAPEPVEPVGQLDAHHVFCVPVAALSYQGSRAFAPPAFSVPAQRRNTWEFPIVRASV
jgi:hypothetical protein